MISPMYHNNLLATEPQNMKISDLTDKGIKIIVKGNSTRYKQTDKNKNHRKVIQ